jgi:hypothetical protein
MNRRLNQFVKFSVTLAFAVMWQHPAAAKDAFGLDRFKNAAEDITKPEVPYRTKYGSQISVYSIKNSLASDAPVARFLLQGGLHGNELLGSEFVAWLAQRFAAGESLLNTLNQGQVEIDFVPYANPDGTIQFTRYNGNRINLNRNFGILWGVTKENPGTKAFSEVETRAIRDLLNARQYRGAVDIHGYINWVVIPTAPEDSVSGLPKTKPATIAKYQRWADFIKKETMNRLPGYEVKTAGSLGDGGAFEDYAWWGAGIPSACLELFSTDRFIPKTLAEKIVDLLTPKAFGTPNALGQNSDMFLVYENYVHSLFQESLRIKSGQEDIKQLASSSKRNH